MYLFPVIVFRSVILKEFLNFIQLMIDCVDIKVVLGGGDRENNVFCSCSTQKGLF